MSNDRQTSPGEFVMMAGLLAVVAVIFIILILILAPGMLLNLMLDRFADTPDGFIKSSINDEMTWIVSAVFWFVVIVWGTRRYKRYINNTSGS